MVDTEITKRINNFIKVVKEKIGFIVNIEYEYDSFIDEYMIWHDIAPSKEMELEDLLGNLIYDYFYQYEIYNISFGYNAERLMELAKNNVELSDLDKKINSFFFINSHDTLMKNNLYENLHISSVTCEQKKRLNFTENNIPIILKPDSGELKKFYTKFLLSDNLVNTTRNDSQENMDKEALIA